MASVCGSTLALMDAGVPLKNPVAGVAMGLIMGEGGQAAVLTDIAGIEDHLGDMDFKVAGTVNGINALQMDVKVKGLTYDALERALKQAKEGRLFILDKMRATIAEPRDHLSQYAPKMVRIMIPVNRDRGAHRAGWAYDTGPAGKKPALTSTSKTTAACSSGPAATPCYGRPRTK